PCGARPRDEDWGIGGLSMGGAATINASFTRPDLFRYVIVLSAGGGQNLDTAYPRFFGNGAAAAKQMKLIWIAAGDGDFALDRANALDATLTAHGVNHVFKITPGRHEWRLWRAHPHECAPLVLH